MSDGRLRRLTRSVRERAPHGLVMALRRVLDWWGAVTSRWRLRPTFVVVGAQRAGTTTLYRLLSDHPQVSRPTVSKGIGYFDVHYARGLRWYVGHFPVRWLARRRHGADVVTFESSGYYLFHPLVAARMARDLPGVRVVVVVREPVERAYSAHRHETARGFETESFERALELEDARVAGEVERLEREPGYTSYHHRHHAYLARSRYSEQIDRFIDALGADHVYIVDADSFFADPGAEFARLQEWLGLSEHVVTEAEHWNAQPRTPMAPELRERLQQHFEPYDARLAEQMGRVPSWRSSETQD